MSTETPSTLANSLRLCLFRLGTSRTVEVALVRTIVITPINEKYSLFQSLPFEHLHMLPGVSHGRASLAQRTVRLTLRRLCIRDLLARSEDRWVVLQVAASR